MEEKVKLMEERFFKFKNKNEKEEKKRKKEKKNLQNTTYVRTF